MAEVAYDYYTGGAAPSMPAEPARRHERKQKPEIKKVRKTVERASYEQHKAVLKRVAKAGCVLLIVSPFVVGSIWSLYTERAQIRKISEMKTEYKEISAMAETLRAQVEAKITASVISDIAENKLGMVKIPESNKVYSDTGSSNGVVND